VVSSCVQLRIVICWGRESPRISSAYAGASEGASTAASAGASTGVRTTSRVSAALRRPLAERAHHRFPLIGRQRVDMRLRERAGHADDGAELLQHALAPATDLQVLLQSPRLVGRQRVVEVLGDELDEAVTREVVEGRGHEARLPSK